VVLIAFEKGLSTAEVFAEADRQGAGRTAQELEEISGRLWAVASGAVSPLAYPSLLVNDLEPAAMSLEPGIGSAMDRLALAGSGFVGMTGSGPTVFGICPTREAAEAVAAEVGPGAILCRGGVGL
jgi:4-diphosphocytidyl-2-C-methyl-D-erythritol kinase